MTKSCDCTQNCFCMTWHCPNCERVVRNRNEFCNLTCVTEHEFKQRMSRIEAQKAVQQAWTDYLRRKQ